MPAADLLSERASNHQKPTSSRDDDASPRRTYQSAARSRSRDANGDEITALPTRGGERRKTNASSTSSHRTGSPDASRNSSTTSLTRQSTAQGSSGSSEKKAKEQPQAKKKRTGMLGFLTLKEPSTSAWEEFADQQRKMTSQKGARATSVGMPGISSKKLPEGVPKVNSKWNGLPPDGKKRLAERESLHKSHRGSSVSSPTRASRRSVHSSTSASDEAYSSRRSKLGSVSSEASQSQQRQHRPSSQSTVSRPARDLHHSSTPVTESDNPVGFDWGTPASKEQESKTPTTSEDDRPDLYWFNRWAEQDEQSEHDDTSETDTASMRTASHTGTRTPTPQEASPLTPHMEMPHQPLPISVATENPPAITSATGTLWFDETDPDDIIFVKRAGADVLGPPIGFRKPKPAPLEPIADETSESPAGAKANSSSTSLPFREKPRPAPINSTIARHSRTAPSPPQAASAHRSATSNSTASYHTAPSATSATFPSNPAETTTHHSYSSANAKTPHPQEFSQFVQGASQPPPNSNFSDNDNDDDNNNNNNNNDDDDDGTEADIGPDLPADWPLSQPVRNNSAGAASVTPSIMSEQWNLAPKERLGLGGKVTRKADVVPWEKFEPPRISSPAASAASAGKKERMGRGKRFSGLLGRK
ncbi:hypothetical protein MBLNU230_g7222t1 [Neophaeotheca triangularis]